MESTFAAGFDEITREAPVPDQIQSLRQAGYDRFTSLGFPTTKNEDWHYTSVSPIAEEEFTLLTARTDDAQASQLDPFYFRDERWPTAVFVNGRFSPALSSLKNLPEGVRFEALADAWKRSKATDEIGHVATTDNYAFTALNTALMYDGALVEIAKDAQVPGAIHLLYVTDATAAKGQMHPRAMIIAGRHSKATVIESYVSLSDARYFTNAVTEVSVAEGANLSHYKIQREGLRAYHVGTIEVRQARDSHYQSFSNLAVSRRTSSLVTLIGRRRLI